MKSSRIITILLISAIATSVVATGVETTTSPTAVVLKQTRNLKVAFSDIPTECALIMVDAAFRFAAFLDSLSGPQVVTTRNLRQSAPSNPIRMFFNQEELSSCSQNRQPNGYGSGRIITPECTEMASVIVSKMQDAQNSETTDSWLDGPVPNMINDFRTQCDFSYRLNEPKETGQLKF